MDASLELFLQRLPDEFQSRLVTRESAFLPPNERGIAGLALADGVLLKETPRPAYLKRRLPEASSVSLSCWLATDPSLERVADLARNVVEWNARIGADLKRLLEAQGYWAVSFQPEWEDIDVVGIRDVTATVEALREALVSERPQGFLYHAGVANRIP